MQTRASCFTAFAAARGWRRQIAVLFGGAENPRRPHFTLRRRGGAAASWLIHQSGSCAGVAKRAYGKSSAPILKRKIALENARAGFCNRAEISRRFCLFFMFYCGFAADRRGGIRRFSLPARECLGKRSAPLKIWVTERHLQVLLLARRRARGIPARFSTKARVAK